MKAGPSGSPWLTSESSRAYRNACRDKLPVSHDGLRHATCVRVSPPERTGRSRIIVLKLLALNPASFVCGSDHPELLRTEESIHSSLAPRS